MKIFTWIQYVIRFVHLLLLALFIVIKSYFFGHSKRTTSLFDRQCRIAIVGGGIAGVAAAYSLVRQRYQDVTIYEASSKLGGNARTHQWQTNRFSVITGLSVLAWPKFFRNYNHLLQELNIHTTTVQLPFFIHNRKENRYFAHGQQHNHNQEFNQDLKRWQKMVSVVTSMSKYLHGEERSLYYFTIFNPFNYIPLHFLSFFFGISTRFWHQVVVPMYASSFLSTHLTFIPASILPIIDEIISLQPDRIPVLNTWTQTSVDVFQRMTEGTMVKTSSCVEKVHIQRTSDGRTLVTINDEPNTYDRIIFACNSEAILNALVKGKTSISRLLHLMLTSVNYAEDENDLNLLDGIIHHDLTVFPSDYQEELRKHYANYIDVHYDEINREFFHYNTFILSSWLPNVRLLMKENQITDQELEPMLVTYARHDKIQPNIDPKKIVGYVNNRRAHPSLSFRNQAIALLARLIQGENGMYFCGTMVTPANGHELSLNSGFAVAEMIGARYPFMNDSSSFRDYLRFKHMCIDSI